MVRKKFLAKDSAATTGRHALPEETALSSAATELDATNSDMKNLLASSEIATIEEQTCRLASFPQLNPNPVLEVDSSGKITFANPATHKTLEKLGLDGSATGMFIPPDLNEILKKWKGKEDATIQCEIELQGRLFGETIFLTSRFGVARIYASDITESKRAQDALAESEQRVRRKLECIIAPQSDISNLDLADIIDAPSLQSLVDDFYELTGMPMGMIDIEGKVLVGVGWKEICTRFHRIHPETRKNCLESDVQLSAGVPPGEYKIYKCRNNLWDVATPVMVGDRQFGNLFMGQFFFEDEPLDYEFFRSQAGKYGFDEKEYIAALDAVPRLSRETLNISMNFFMKLADILSKQSYSNLKLARSLAERDDLMGSLCESEERFRNMFERHNAVMLLIEPDSGAIVDANAAAIKFYGHSRDKLRELKIQELNQLPPESVAAERHRALEEHRNHFVFTHCIATGEVRWVEVYSTPVVAQGKTLLFSVIHDITERNRAEEELRESEEQLRLAQQAARIGSFDLNLQTGLNHWTPELEAMYGLARGEFGMTQPSWENLVHPDDRTDAINLVNKAFATGEPVEGEWRVVWPDGSEHWLFGRFQAYRNDAGTPLHLTGVNIDVTERKRVENALHESELFYRQTLDSIPGMVFTTNPDGYCDYQSQQWVDFTGVPMSEHLGDGWNKLLHPDDRPRAFAAWHAAVEGRAPYDLEYRVRRHDGVYEWFKVQGRPIRDAAGQIVRWFGTALNIDYLVKAQEALRQQEERLRLALAAARMASWEWNIASGSVVWNDTHYRMMGYEPREVQPSYHAWANRVHPDDREATQQLIERCMVERRIYTAEFRTLWPDGTIRWLEARGDFEYDANKQPLRNFGVMLDITERKRAEEDLRQAKEASEAATRSKNQFLANMSHELRTPMTGVIGMLDLVLTGNLEKEQQECIEIARTAASSLVRLLNDILDLTKIEMGKFSMEENPLSIRQCVETTYNILVPMARSKGLAFIFTVDDDVPEALIGDQVRLNQILTNLAGNAVKFTEKGKVTIRVVSGGSTPGGKREITFTVTDTGIGIPEDKQHLLFGIFSQVDASHSRSYGGSGLGLAISREIVERMGGTIGFTSEAGKGSTFSCTIPFSETNAFLDARKTATLGVVPVSEAAGKARLLVAEDDQVISKVIRLMFERAQFDVDLVENGHKVLEKWETGQYDLILMDVQMPIMNGFKATAAIREKERTLGGHIPIIAMTAHALKEDEDRCLAAGMDAYISKPIDFNKSVRLIEDILKNNRS